MKKFFRTLALVLALTLVIGTIPASAADVKPLEKKTLYVDGAKGTTEAGKKSTYKAKVALYKLAGFAKKADAEGTEISVKLAEGEKLVSADDKYVYAEKFGKTTITLTVGGKDYAVAMTIKQNATDVTIDGLKDGDKVTTGSKVVVKLPRKTTDTDARRLFVNGEAVAEIKDAARQYEIAFAKAGEYEIKAEAYQGTKYNAATATKTIKVTAVDPAIVETKQIATNAFTVEFDAKVEGVITTLADDAVYVEVGADKTKVNLGVVKTVVAKDNKVTVTMYNDFQEKTEYKCEIAGSIASFTAKKFEVKDIAKVIVECKDPVKDADTPIVIKYFNAEDIDITNSVKSLFTPSIVVSSDYAWTTKNAKGEDCIYFYEADKTATIKVTVSLGWNEVNGVYSEDKVEGSLLVTSISAAAKAITSKAYSFAQTPDKAIHTIRMGETGKLVVEYKYSDDTKADEAGYGIKTIKIADESIAMVATAGQLYIKPVRAGKTTVIAYDKDGKAIDAFALEVLSANKAEKAEVTLDKTYLNVEPGLRGGDDKIVGTLSVKDSNLKDTTDYTVEIKQVDKNAANDAKGVTLTTLTEANVTNGKFEISATQLGGTAVPTKSAVKVIFTVTVKAKDTAKTVLCSQTFSVYVQNLTGTDPNGFKLQASETALDIAAVYRKDNDASKVCKTSDIQLFATYGNFNKGIVPFTMIKKDASIPTVASEAGVGITSASSVYFVAMDQPKDGPLTPGVPTNAAATITGASITNITIGATQAACKVGTYTFYAYLVEYKNAGDKLSKKAALGSCSVVVSDSTEAPIVVMVDGAKDKAVTAAGYTVEWAGKVNKADTAAADRTAEIVDVIYTTDAQTGNIYVEKVKVALKAVAYGDGAIVKEVAVGKLCK